MQSSTEAEFYSLTVALLNLIVQNRRVLEQSNREDSYNPSMSSFSLHVYHENLKRIEALKEQGRVFGHTLTNEERERICVQAQNAVPDY